MLSSCLEMCGWSIKLRRRILFVCAPVCAFTAVWLLPAGSDLSGAAAAQVQPPNRLPIILISVDTLRADHLSCYGYKRIATPHIDRMAAGGTLFSQVSSQIPLTLPSHVSLLTSTYPFANGIEDNGERLGPNAVTLARVFKSQGYRTAAFVGGFVLDRRFGLDQGFDVYDGPSNPRPQPGKDPGDIKRFGEDVIRAATQWLDTNSNQPFFLFVHLYDLHTPYTLPSSERRRGMGYDPELGYVDDVLGKFWNFLEQRGLLERALVVFTSDHGESLGEHGESTHGYFTYQSTLRVPLIIHWPMQPTTFVPRVAEPVSLMDVAPTLLQIAGIATPAEFQGQSLMALATGGAPAGTKASAPEEIYSESLYPHAHFGTSALRTLRFGAYKYIKAPRPELYDQAQDPAESNNLYESQKSKALALRARIDKLLSRYGPRAANASSTLQPEALEKLRSLGYIAGDVSSVSSADSGADPKDRISQYEKYGRAIELASAGRLSAANTILKQLLSENPNLPDVRSSLGLNQQKLGRHAEAAANFKAVVKQNPRSVIAHFNLALSEHALGRKDEALKELEAALALAPYYVRAEEMLATLYLEKRNFEEARARLNHLLEVDPVNYAAHYNLGALDILQANFQEGERHLRAAIRADASSAEAHNALGSLLLRRGDLEPARAEFAEAIRLNPQFAFAHYNLGMIFRKQSKDDEAVAEFRQALSADPKFRPARDALERLRAVKE